jgi:hypothetical protein
MNKSARNIELLRAIAAQALLLFPISCCIHLIYEENCASYCNRRYIFFGPFVLVEYSSGEKMKIGISGEPFSYTDAKLQNIVI